MSKIKPQFPKIDNRRHAELVERLKRMAPFYTPEWEPGQGDAGTALLNIFSYFAGTVINRLNQVPYKHFAAFLDMLGVQLLPAQPSKVPLHFKLTKGAEKEVLVPPGTMAAAGKTEEHDEMPFETIKNLLAVPGSLLKVISIDPEEDAIYIPPPGFTAGDIREGEPVSYKIISSLSTGAKNFQLDHVTGLEAGDFLKIGTGTNIEYAIISAIKGNIIFITHGLEKEFPDEETPVEKLAVFSLFEGKNMQEHSIYIAHKDLFNMNSPAHFVINIKPQPGTMAGLEALQLLWEYWGEKQDEEGQDWRKLNIIKKEEVNDEYWEIELKKEKEGEIKEKEINGIKSRWIRCRLQKPLKVPGDRKLPELDNIVFNVRSAGENIEPDQAFYNEIPLDIVQSYYPFGKEPRMYDTFSIGGKEIFSKKGAEVSLDVEVGTLGPSRAIYYSYYKVEERETIEYTVVFAVGVYGQLISVGIGTEERYRWIDVGCPPNTSLVPGSTPDAIQIGKKILVFAIAENGHLIEGYTEFDKMEWIDHGLPKEEVKANFNPVVIEFWDSKYLVFVVGSDGAIYEYEYKYSVDYKSIEGKWIEHGKPLGISIDSSPCIESYNDGVNLMLFVKGKDGKLYTLEKGNGDNAGSWKTDYGSPGIAALDSRPFVGTVSFDGSHVTVYGKGSDGNLWEFDTKKKWNKFELPNGIYVDSAPHGSHYGKLSIFIKGSDDCLWEWNGEWISHKSPGYSKPVLSPFVLSVKENYHVFLASHMNTIIEKDINKGTWNEYKDSSEEAVTPTLSWEYWNTNGWVALKGINDGTANLLNSGTITFPLPKNIEETEVAGQKNYWIRARVVGGDYGKETYSFYKKISNSSNDSEEEQKLISTKATIRPPVINKLDISYELTDEQFPQHCLTYNNLEYMVRTEETKNEGKHFAPFKELEEQNKTLYLGFEKFFKGGPIKIFFNARELDITDKNKPKLAWNRSRKNDWAEINCNDYTEALIKADILEFIGDADFSPQSIFGQYLYWLKGSLVNGKYEKMPQLQGIYPNTTWAIQGKTFWEEILGSSSGQPHQTFTLLNTPVQKGQEIRVREIISKEEKETLTRTQGQDAVKEITGGNENVKENWVLWTEVPNFFHSGQTDRHYTLDPAVGLIVFGNGTSGMIPPAGEDNIKAFSYQCGGGKAGNVKAGEITALKSAVAGIDSVINPAAADGGAETASLDEMLEIGPAVISHKNRAVTPADFEWLAKQAARKIAKARCLPNTKHENGENKTEPGRVTIVIVPDTPDPAPTPTPQLRGIVKKYLETHGVNTLAEAGHIYVTGPTYKQIGVSIQVFVTTIDAATEVDGAVRKKLDAFFHPLTGGPQGNGWDFGRNVTASDVYALLEDIGGVDHIENLQFTLDGKTEQEDIVEIGKDVLVSNGTHSIELQIQKRKGG